MNQPVLHFIQYLICSFKSGWSPQKAVQDYKVNYPSEWGALYLSRENNPPPYDSLEYELFLLLERSYKGLPITKNLEGLYKRANEKLEESIEKHARQSPFLALLPLFLFQVPSLVLIFFYPLIDSFLKELQ